MSIERLPYPEPLDEGVSRRMVRNRRRDTQPELKIRRQLHQAGYRFRVDYRLDIGSVSVRPDIVFTRKRVAVFVDGCFWHSCPLHGNVPARNLDYWGPKLQRTSARDARVGAALAADGWEVLRVWEHEDPRTAATMIAGVVDGFVTRSDIPARAVGAQ